MLLTIDKLLSAAEVEAFRSALRAAPWVDGKTTAGTLAVHVKNNEQLDDQSPTALDLANHLLRKLGHHALFLSAAMPLHINPPRFNRYRNGHAYGVHVDGAIMPLAGTDRLMRSDLAATLFLSDPRDYDGGELTIETSFGAQEVKLAAGDMVLYPSSSLHQVQPVTRGERLAAFLWVQSMVADQDQRTLLFDLDQTIQSLAASRSGADPAVVRLTAVYHNLVRRWAAT
jgi:PKHD-type hydroxylase